MRWLGLVLCLLWFGWRLQALWQWGQQQWGQQRWGQQQWGQQQWRPDPLSNQFQQELRRRGLIRILP